MDKYLRTTISVGIIFAIGYGGVLFASYGFAGSMWKLALLILLIAGYTFFVVDAYCSNTKFADRLNRYAKQYHLTPIDLEKITGIGRGSFSCDFDQYVTFSGKGKEQKQILAKLRQNFDQHT